MTKQINVMDIVGGTIKNSDGFSLFQVMDSNIKEGNKLKLDLQGCTPFSTSFLSSSFGQLMEVYGMDGVRNYISLVNYKPSMANSIKNYLVSMKEREMI